MRRNPQLYTCDGPWPSHLLERARADVLLELGLAEFSAGRPDWRDHLEGAVESATDDDAEVVAALACRCIGLGSASGRGRRGVRIALLPAWSNSKGHLVLEAMAVAIGSIDADVAAATRACQCLDEAGGAQRPSRYALAVAADEAALAISAGGTGSRLG